MQEWFFELIPTHRTLKFFSGGLAILEQPNLPTRFVSWTNNRPYEPNLFSLLVHSKPIDTMARSHIRQSEKILRCIIPFSLKLLLVETSLWDSIHFPPNKHWLGKSVDTQKSPCELIAAKGGVPLKRGVCDDL